MAQKKPKVMTSSTRAVRAPTKGSAVAKKVIEDATVEQVANEMTAIDIREIEADFRWNARSETMTRAEQASGPAGQEGTMGLAGLRKSLEEHGQDTPVWVRPISGKGKKKYQLVAGFRRFAAVEQMADKAIAIKGLQRYHILARVQPMSDVAARALNLRENTDRNDLSGPDIALGAKELEKLGMTQMAIAGTLDRDQGYISRLLTIANGLRPDLFARWRNSTVQVNYLKILPIAKESPDKQEALFDQLFASATKGKNGGNEHTERWVQAAMKRAREVGEIVGLLEGYGLIQAEALHWLDHLNVYVDKIKDDATEAQRIAIADAADQAYVEGLERKAKRQAERAASDAERARIDERNAREDERRKRIEAGEGAE